MELLRFFEGIRTPLFNAIFSAVTILGEETIFILIGLLFFWCINKKKGYYILSIGLMGTVANQFLKLLFRIPRPWVIDDKFTIVESVREGAGGYSFPSGHTQTAVGAFGAIGHSAKKTAIRIICIAICVLVPISRMYLGVHTPLDVGVSIIISLAMVFGLYPIMCGKYSSKKNTRIVLAACAAIAAIFVAFINIYKFPEDIDITNLTHGIENSYKMLGCTLALWIAFEVDEKWLHFETKAVWWAQVLKIVLGLIPVLIVKSLLKAPITAVFGEYIGDGIRYFLLTLVAGCAWPATFKWFSRLGKKDAKTVNN